MATNTIMGDVIMTPVSATIRITPEDVAQLFWNMPCYKQAEFWQKLQDLTKDHVADRGMQWLAMAKYMPPEVKRLIAEINDHVNGE
jgi:hypothetical protein